MTQSQATTQPCAIGPGQEPSFLLLVTLALIGTFAFLHVYSLQSILPDLQRDLDASVVQIGNAVGVTILAMALASPAVGMLSDALGRKWLILVSVMLLAVPSALMTLVHSVQTLLWLRFLQGLMVPGAVVVVIAYVAEEFQGATMIRAMSVLVTGNVLGGFMGRFLMGHFTDLMGWRLAFGMLALLNLGGAAMIWRVLPASRNFRANRRIADSLVVLRHLIANRAVHATCALASTILFVQVGMFTFVNLHLAAAPYHFGPAQLANVFAVYLVGLVLTPLAGRFIPRVGVHRTLLASIGLSALGVLLTLVPPAWGIIAGLMLASCGTFITQSATSGFLGARVTEGRSLAGGLYYLALYGGGFAGAWLGGICYSMGQWPATVTLLVAVQLLGWIAAWRLVH